MTDFLCALKKEGPGYSLELSFDSIKSALDAALEILAFADADCYLANPPKEKTKTTPPIQYENDMPFRDTVRQYRQDHGYTQKEIAKLLGVTQQTICFWESGGLPHRNTEAEVRRKLSKGELSYDL